MLIKFPTFFQAGRSACGGGVGGDLLAFLGFSKELDHRLVGSLASFNSFSSFLALWLWDR